LTPIDVEDLITRIEIARSCLWKAQRALEGGDSTEANTELSEARDAVGRALADLFPRYDTLPCIEGRGNG
jgi:hypothetical protein